MEGNVVATMCEGIDNSVAVVAFVTRNYVEKVASSDMADNCKKEFLYTDRRKTSEFM